MSIDDNIADDDRAEAAKVLLVDDDEVNLLLTSMALRERGFAVTEATSGEAAIAMLRDWSPDVIVLDGLMPGLDGFQTCRVVRAMVGPRVASRADADGPRRRRIDHARLRSRRHRLLRQVFAMEPARRPAEAFAAQLAHAPGAGAQQVEVGARAGPGAHGQFRLAHRPWAADPVGRRTASLRLRGRASTSASGVW